MWFDSVRLFGRRGPQYSLVGWDANIKHQTSNISPLVTLHCHPNSKRSNCKFKQTHEEDGCGDQSFHLDPTFKKFLSI